MLRIYGHLIGPDVTYLLFLLLVKTEIMRYLWTLKHVWNIIFPSFVKTFVFLAEFALLLLKSFKDVLDIVQNFAAFLI